MKKKADNEKYIVFYGKSKSEVAAKRMLAEYALNHMKGDAAKFVLRAVTL